MILSALKQKSLYLWENSIELIIIAFQMWEVCAHCLLTDGLMKLDSEITLMSREDSQDK